MNKIESRQNKTIKWLNKLYDNKSLKESGKCFVCQTFKVVSTLIEKNNKPKTFFVTEKFYHENKNFLRKYDEVTYVLAPSVYESVSAYKNDDGIIAIFDMKKNEFDIKNHTENKKSNYLALCNIQNPSNLGAIIRSAVAFNISAIFLVGNNVDLYHHEVIKASAGYFNSIPSIAYNTLEYFMSVMKQNKITTIATVLNKSSINILDYKKENSACFLIGNEGSGLPPSIIKSCDKNVHIGLLNGVESLNVAIASSIIAFYIQNENNKDK